MAADDGLMRTPRALIWVFGIAAVALQAGALWLLRADAVPILSAGIPSMLALVGADVWANRKGE